LIVCDKNQSIFITLMIQLYVSISWYLFKTLVLVLIFCLSHIFRHMYKLGKKYEILDSHHLPQKNDFKIWWNSLNFTAFFTKIDKKKLACPIFQIIRCNLFLWIWRPFSKFQKVHFLRNWTGYPIWSKSNK
jgi:hypothetical protein